jgi:ketosteroid isomerase-like protein
VKFARHSILCALATIVILGELAVADSQEQPVLQADHDFVAAVAKSDTNGVSAFMDQDFAWTDSAGKTIDRPEVLRNLPKPASGDESGAEVKEHTYGDVAVVTSVRGRVHVVRIWTHGKSGWRALVYHEATLAEKSEPPKPGPTDCENPCKTLPYTPKNAAEQGIITSWQALETAVTNHDSAGWAPHVADEFILINSNNDHVYTKADRMEILDKQKASGSGSAPVPLVSAHMFDFGDAVVMTAQHQRGDAKPIHVSRVWIKRDGQWVMAFSEQTIVQ